MIKEIKDTLLQYQKFISIFLKNPFKVGAVFPSSEQLAQSITEMANLVNKNSVVELGPGTGVFTEKILNKINPETCFFSLELDPHFVNETQKRCPQAIVYHSSANKIQDYLSIHQQKSCDVVISGIPWTLFDSHTQNSILKPIYDSLEPGGSFLTFIYLTGMYLPGGISFRKKIKKQFKTITRSKVVWKNFPPVFIYHCQK